MAFFTKYLSDAVRGSDTPVIAPQMYTINDFFYKVSGVNSTDRVCQLLDMYKSYTEVFALHNTREDIKPEALDEFIFWGDVILGDFNDVDKYLANPKQLFANVADLKRLQDDYSYLTEAQRKAIEGFVSHFSDLSGKLTVDLDSDNPDVKGRFLQIWNILYPLYQSASFVMSAV